MNIIEHLNKIDLLMSRYIKLEKDKAEEAARQYCEENNLSTVKITILWDGESFISYMAP